MSTIRLVMLGLLLLSAPAFAERPLSVTAKLIPGDTSLFEHQVSELTLTIEARNIQIGKRIEIQGLPDATKLRLGSFLPLPPENIRQGDDQVETKRFRAEMTALTTGSVSIAIQLVCPVGKTVPSIFGSMYTEQPAAIPVQPVTVNIRPLPLPGRPADFSGAVGTFVMNASLEPSIVAPGELVRARITLSGSGWTNGVTAPAFSLPDHFRVYESKAAPPGAGELLRWEQTIVPQTTNAAVITPLTFAYFDPKAGRYVQTTVGPFRLSFREAITTHITPFAATGLVTASAAKTNTPDTQRPNATPESRWLTSQSRKGTPVVIPKATQALFAPHQQASATFSIPANTTVRIVESYGSWVRIRYNDNSGWIPAPTAPSP